jgi:lipopolysaccharide transport system permease protein
MTTSNKEYPQKEQEWTETITAEGDWFDFKLKELWNYRDLISLFVWRDFIATYKQTLLGPAWHFFSPLLSTVVNTVIFGVIAGISSEGIPAFLFQLCSMMCWTFFAKSINAVQNTFSANAGIFGKVYFPRLAVPVSSWLSACIQFGIMMLLFVSCWIYYQFFTEANLSINFVGLLFLPAFLLIMTLHGFGIGAIIAAFSTKYRDLNNFIGYAISFLMYTSAVVYPMSDAYKRFGKYADVLSYNPIVPLMEACRNSLLNIGSVSINSLLYSLLVGMTIFFLGLVAFHRTERNFIDSV